MTRERAGTEIREGSATDGNGVADLGVEEAMRAVQEALGRIRFGSILITIHQGEVVGIETSTKVRLKATR
jgi:hypothetical protein